MYQIPPRNVSLMLSEVLEDVGVSEVIITKRRRSALIQETMNNCVYKILGKPTTVYHFGSSAEGTTTLGLCSDIDILFSVNNVNVIMDWADWRFGAWNLLMLQDEDTIPGHCMLQWLRSDVPLPESEVGGEHDVMDRHGRILLKKSVILTEIPEVSEQHGPAFALGVLPGVLQQDMVFAFQCKTLPREVRHWLDHRTRGSCLTQEMKRWIKTKGCFVVPVSCRYSVNAELEWRISTSCAEKCLMFSLNITQMRVYVLMKMLLKAKLNVNIQRDHHISSYMCKTVLLHCIEKSDFMTWQSHNLLPCLLYCLFTLRSFISQETCPQFIFHESNIMSGKFTEAVKIELHRNITAVLQDVIGSGILGIKTDNIGLRLIRKTSNIFDGAFDDVRILRLNIYQVLVSLIIQIACKVQEVNQCLLEKLCKVSWEIQIAMLQTYIYVS